MQLRIDASNSRINGLAWVEARKSLRYRDDRSHTIADKSRLIGKWQVIRQLQWCSGANFLSAKENSVSSTNDRIPAGCRSPCEANARRKVCFVGLNQASRSAVLTSNHNGSGCVVEVRLMIVLFNRGREVVIAQSQVERETRRNLPVILHKQRRHMLSVVQSNYRRNSRVDRKSQQHISQRTATCSIHRIFGEITIERELAPWRR